jgi:predicted ATPase/DNA-binding SARP family transcriptional activator
VGSAELDFRLLGPLEVERDGEALALGGARQRALLALLLLSANEVVSRARLIDGLWAERPPETAANALQVAVHGLRKLLGAKRISTSGSGYLLRVQPGELDLERADRLGERARGQAPAAAAETLRAALELWRGRALADLAELPFARTESERLEERRLALLERRIEADLALGRHAELGSELEALIAEHPFRERLRGLLMLALYRSGRQADALEAYQEARRALVEQLGIEPGPELQELERGILRQDPSLAAPAAAAEAATNVPAPLTPLVGRQLEVAAVSALLRGADVRLLTLTGPGGTGKTRLAVAAVGELRPDFRDGVFFVDLSPLDDPELVAPTIARTLGVDERPGQPLADTLADALRDKQLLLLLDNFERVADAGALVTRLLAGAREVKAVVTSRALLRVSGEHEYAVPPLSRDEAVRLFVARAQAVSPGFEPSPAVAAICTALDGLPLALELAAARSRVLTPEAILERLGSRLDLLTSGPRDLPRRQRTLRGAIDWSFELLEPAEQALFARLAVFSGGCSLEAAEHVCAADLDALSALVDRSLARQREARFTMLETIREYALERLDASAEGDGIRLRHAEHFLELAERAQEPISGGAEQARWLDRLEIEHDNLRAAFAWLRATGRIDLELRLAVALRLFWRLRGHLTEGRAVLEAAIARSADEPPALRAEALAAVEVLAFRQGDYTATAAFCEEARELYSELGDRLGIARMTGELGNVLHARGELDRALELYGEAVSFLREIGDTARLSTALANMGSVANAMGDYDRSAALTEEAAEMHRADGDRDGLAIALHNLARTELKRGRPERARELFRESLEIAVELGYRELIAYCLEAVAELLADVDPATAARLVGAADALFEELGVPMGSEEKAGRERAVGLLRDALGEETFSSLRSEGGGLAPEQAAAAALDRLRGPRELV